MGWRACARPSKHNARKASRLHRAGRATHRRNASWRKCVRNGKNNTLQSSVFLAVSSPTHVSSAGRWAFSLLARFAFLLSLFISISAGRRRLSINPDYLVHRRTMARRGRAEVVHANEFIVLSKRTNLLELFLCVIRLRHALFPGPPGFSISPRGLRNLHTAITRIAYFLEIPWTGPPRTRNVWRKRHLCVSAGEISCTVCPPAPSASLDRRPSLPNTRSTHPPTRPPFHPLPTSTCLAGQLTVHQTGRLTHLR